jgi:hypothetical protein
VTCITTLTHGSAYRAGWSLGDDVPSVRFPRLAQPSAGLFFRAKQDAMAKPKHSPGATTPSVVSCEILDPDTPNKNTSCDSDKVVGNPAGLGRACGTVICFPQNLASHATLALVFVVASRPVLACALRFSGNMLCTRRDRMRARACPALGAGGAAWTLAVRGTSSRHAPPFEQMFGAN